jgi:hypothetical protein
MVAFVSIFGYVDYFIDCYIVDHIYTSVTT